jgi:ubiquinone/menaquinone biosynthesis C-methylase UbiE
MQIADLKMVDELWLATQPYMAAQVMQGYRRQTGQVLELGPFAGGIAIELAKQCPQLEITVAEESAETLKYIREKIKAAGFADSIVVEQTNLDKLTFADASFDLIIFRGAFFFLAEKKNLLTEILRVLRKGGFALIGGGHGKGVPESIVKGIAGELRILHGKLGGRWLGIEELQEIIDRSPLRDNCKITQEGGVWLNIRK